MHADDSTQGKRRGLRHDVTKDKHHSVALYTVDSPCLGMSIERTSGQQKRHRESQKHVECRWSRRTRYGNQSKTRSCSPYAGRDDHIYQKMVEQRKNVCSCKRACVAWQKLRPGPEVTCYGRSPRTVGFACIITTEGPLRKPRELC